MRRSSGGSLFHARGPAAAKDRSPSDDIVHGTATELDAADLRPGLTVAAADGVIRSARYDGASPYKQQCTIIHSLYSTLQSVAGISCHSALYVH